MVKTLYFQCQGIGSSPGWRAKITQDLWPKNQNKQKKKQKERYNKFNKDKKKRVHIKKSLQILTRESQDIQQIKFILVNLSLVFFFVERRSKNDHQFKWFFFFISIPKYNFKYFLNQIIEITISELRRL